jgi:hypothetical protein
MFGAHDRAQSQGWHHREDMDADVRALGPVTDVLGDGFFTAVHGGSKRYLRHDDASSLRSHDSCWLCRNSPDCSRSLSIRFGLVLTLVGIFRMKAYAVARRTREIGVRLAFGARPAQVVGVMVRDAVSPVLFGLLAGLAGTYYATRIIRSFLFETAPHDPATLVAVVGLLAAAACLAAWLPATRAASADPVTALRAE